MGNPNFLFTWNRYFLRHDFWSLSKKSLELSPLQELRYILFFQKEIWFDSLQFVTFSQLEHLFRTIAWNWEKNVLNSFFSCLVITSEMN